MTSPCGCNNDQSGECFCVVAPSPTIEPSGAGTASSPLVFDLVPGSVVTEIVERDTDTVDMHVTELGPGRYEVAADVPLSEDTNNALVYGTDGKLMVHAAQPALPPITWRMTQSTGQSLQPNQMTQLQFDVALAPDSPTGNVFEVPRSGWYDAAGFVQMANPDGGIYALSICIGNPANSTDRYSGTGVGQFPQTIGAPGTQFADTVYLTQGTLFSVWAGQWSGSMFTTNPIRTLFTLDWKHE